MFPFSTLGNTVVMNIRIYLNVSLLSHCSYIVTMSRGCVVTIINLLTSCLAVFQQLQTAFHLPISREQELWFLYAILLSVLKTPAYPLCRKWYLTTQAFCSLVASNINIISPAYCQFGNLWGNVLSDNLLTHFLREGVWVICCLGHQKVFLNIICNKWVWETTRNVPLCLVKSLSSLSEFWWM